MEQYQEEFQVPEGMSFPEELIASYLPPKVASLLNKNVRKLSYIDYVKNIMSSDTDIGVSLKTYLENSLHEDYEMACMVDYYWRNIVADEYEEKVFKNTLTKEYALVQYIHDDNSSDFDECYFKLKTNNVEVLEQIKDGENIHLDCAATYFYFMQDENYSELKQENENLFKIAAREWVIEDLKGFIPKHKSKPTKQDVYDIIVCYTWFYFNCVVCELDVVYDKETVNKIRPRENTKVDQFEDIAVIMNKINEMFLELESFMLSLDIGIADP